MSAVERAAGRRRPFILFRSFLSASTAAQNSQASLPRQGSLSAQQPNVDASNAKRLPLSVPPPRTDEGTWVEPVRIEGGRADDGRVEAGRAEEGLVTMV